MVNRIIRYSTALVFSMGFIAGCQLMDMPVAYVGAGIVASVLIVVLFVGSVVRG